MRTHTIIGATLLALAAPLGCTKEPNAPATPTRLEMRTYPQGEQQAGTPITPAIEVAVSTGNGQTVTSGTHTITMSIVTGTGTAGAALGGTVTRTTTNGVAVFDDLVIEKMGSGYRLEATAVNGVALEDATSGPFTVKAAAASRLAFATQPAPTVAGTTFPNPVRVMVTDAYGNLVQQQTTAQVTIAIEGVVPAAGDTTAPLRFTRNGSAVTPINPLAGTLTAELLAGYATFPNLRPRTSGDYDTKNNVRPRLVASAPGLESAVSERFAVTPAPPARVWIAVPPCGDASCAPPFPPVAQQRVREAFVVHAYLLDSLLNPANAGTHAITLSLDANPGGSYLSITPLGGTANGRAAFEVTLSNPGSGYTLFGEASGLTAVASFPFTVTAPASQWVMRDSLHQPRHSMYAAESGGVIYLMAGAGQGTTVYGSMLEYNPTENLWRGGQTRTARAFSATNSAVVNGVLHIVAGNPFGQCTTIHESYNTVMSSWDVPDGAPTSRCHASAVSHNNQVYLVGGWNASSTEHYTQVDVYTPATRTWSLGTPMPAGTFRGGMGAVVHDAKLYLIGGTMSFDDPCTNTMIVFDFAAGTWTSVASMSEDRCGPAVAVGANGRIYVAGGGNDQNRALATVESYDPATNSWRAEPPMAFARQRLALVRVADWLYAIGGQSAGVSFRSVEALQVP